MDRPAVHRSSLPQAWSQPYSRPPSNHHTYPRPLNAPYSPHDQQNPYTAPALYPTAVSQQMPAMPFPNTLMPGAYNTRPRGNSTSGDNSSYFPQPQPTLSFPSPSPSPNFPQAYAYPQLHPPPLQPQSSGYSFPTPNQTQDVVPIRPSPMFARRSSSSPAVNRIPAPEAPPPIPPLPPSYQPTNHPHIPPRVSPAPPPPSIPIPPPGHSYRSDSSPLYDSPIFDPGPPPLSAPPHSRIPSPPRFPTNSPPPQFESDVKRAPVDEEEEALAQAIALSQKESIERSGMFSQEDEDLAKAIEESIRHASSFGISVSSAGAGPSTFPKTTSPLSLPPSLPVSDLSVPPHAPLTSQNTPYASALSSPLLRPVQPAFDDDEAFAHRLAEEERMAATAGPSDHKPPSPLLLSPKPDVTTPPAPPSSSASRKRPEANQSNFTVVNADSDSSSSASRKRQEANQSRFAIFNTDADSEPPPPLYHQVVSAQTSAPAPADISPTLPNRNPHMGRSSSASAVTPSSSRLSPIPGPADKTNLGRSQSVDTGISNSSSAGSSPSVLTIPSSLQTVEESSHSPSVQSPKSPAAPAQANSFIDQQLLSGVSLGFNQPQISSTKTILTGGVPNVISLPTGRFLPFHIQAPDWRHLLKMMARLSGTRIEASVEALAGSKQELKLRTIVQFVRVNSTSQDWRTIVYLTIDSPPPSNAPHKYTNGDVNTLPFSYAASPLPALLRDVPDAPMLKYYTIPATPNTPYPTLPISFPNMAMYLASAVEDSRRMGHDNSSGMKRLAKTLDILYPAQVELGMEDDEPDRPSGGVKNMFRNVFGRGRRDQRRNDDNYADLVTPFVPEWG